MGKIPGEDQGEIWRDQPPQGQRSTKAKTGPVQALGKPTLVGTQDIPDLKQEQALQGSQECLEAPVGHTRYEHLFI